MLLNIDHERRLVNAYFLTLPLNGSGICKRENVQNIYYLASYFSHYVVYVGNVVATVCPLPP